MHSDLKKFLKSINAPVMLFFLIVATIAGYIMIGYFFRREDFILFISFCSFLFFTYYVLIKYARNSYQLLIFASVVFRLVLLFSLPNFSDDFFRFIWDGRLFSAGENPFLNPPVHYISTGQDISGISKELYGNLNSPNYFSIYPAICQYIFWLACKISPGNIQGSVLVMKIIILLAEVGSILIIVKLLKRLSLPKERVLIYALNPLVIIELTGNIHFEAVMIFFLLLAICFLTKKRKVLSAASFGCAVGVKLLPLIFLPFLINRLKLKQSLVYFVITAVTVVILFIPFYNNVIIHNLASSIELYFQKFEFNAGIYYMIRWIGYKIQGYNIIATAGVIMAVITLVLIVFYSIREKKRDWRSFPLAMLIALTIYFALATTVHPWYITTLVALCVFTNYRYPVVWSLMIMLSYHAYQTEIYKENMALVAVEYAVVVCWGIWEYRKAGKRVD